MLFRSLRDTETEARRSFISPLKNCRVGKRPFAKRTGMDLREHFGPEIDRLQGFGLLEEDENQIWLSERGRFFADETVMQLFQKRYLPFPQVGHDLMPE